MLSSVLNSKRAVQVNILIMRAFVKLREVIATHRELAHQIDSLERKYSEHDERIEVIFEAVRNILDPPQASKRQIGFLAAGDQS